jgi:hypothetical protein
MTTDAAWSRFLAYVAHARTKPAWDVEQREWKLEAAVQLRAAIAAAAGGEAGWLPLLLEALNRRRPPFVTGVRQRRWLREWAATEAESLRAAIAGWDDSSAGPAAQVERFERAAGAAEQQSSVITLGSLLNFAAAPDSLPIVRPMVFERLARLLGEPIDHGDGSAPASYEGALGFAALVRARLEQHGVAARDMLDVQSLIDVGVHEAAMWSADPPADWAARASRPLPAGAAYLAVCAVFKNEAPYLREWIEFHRLAGVDRFFLYDNGSTDDHLEVLRPYLDRELVVLHPWPSSPPDQREVFDDCLARHRADARWIAFIDLDEFLFSPAGRGLDELLPGYEASPGVGVEWAMFSVSGNRTRPTGLVVESYPLRDTAETGLFKEIVDPMRTVRCVSAHWFDFEHGLPVDENHWPLTPDGSRSTSFDLLRINHYASRSEEEVREKIARGSGWKHLRRWRARDLEGELDLVPDDAIAPWVAPLRASLEQAGAAR